MALSIFILFDIWKTIVEKSPGDDSLGGIIRGIHQEEYDQGNSMIDSPGGISLVLCNILTC